jgi:hypothetical protein
MTSGCSICETYLKPGQTHADRMKQDHNDILALMKMLEREKRRVEKLKWALNDCIKTNVENARLRDNYAYLMREAHEHLAEIAAMPLGGEVWWRSNMLLAFSEGARPIADRLNEALTQPHTGGDND